MVIFASKKAKTAKNILNRKMLAISILIATTFTLQFSQAKNKKLAIVS